MHLCYAHTSLLIVDNVKICCPLCLPDSQYQFTAVCQGCVQREGGIKVIERDLGTTEYR